MNKKNLYVVSAIVIVVAVVFALVFLLMPKGNKDYKVVSIKNAGGQQITLVGKTINVTINVPTGKTVNVDKVQITAKQGLTKISSLFLPAGVTKSVQVIMPAGKTQVCVSDTDNAELSTTCNGLTEVIVPCPGSKLGFNCTKISDTVFEVSGLSHSIIGDFTDCSGHGTRTSGTCACVAGYYGANCDAKGCKGDTDCDTGYTCDTTKGFCKEKTCATACAYTNGVGVCSKGQCNLLSCLTGWANCNTVLTDGCEINLQTSNTNCGACGTVCATGSACTAGVCVVTTKAIGLDCSKDSDCTSNHCVQAQAKKICSSASSCTACRVVNAAGTDCINAIDSTDPKSDCTTGNTCTAGVCKAITKGLGTGCSTDTDCTSGHCVQGQSSKVCSSVSSCSLCKIINAAGTDCINATASTDPKDECSTDSVLTCGNNGSCDGSGACAKYASGTVCSNATCSNNSFIGQSTCNSSATCIMPSAVSCDDSNECTTDACSISGGCAHTNVDNNTPCSNGTGVCTAGACVIQ